MFKIVYLKVKHPRRSRVVTETDINNLLRFNSIIILQFTHKLIWFLPIVNCPHIHFAMFLDTHTFLEHTSALSYIIIVS